MSLELIMTFAGTINHASGSPVSGGVFVITSVPDAKVRAEAVGVMTQSVVFTFTGGTAAGFVSGSLTASGSIPASSLKVRASGLLVVREGDSATITFTGSLPGGGTSTIAGDVEVDNAGQTTVRAE